MITVQLPLAVSQDTATDSSKLAATDHYALLCRSRSYYPMRYHKTFFSTYQNPQARGRHQAGRGVSHQRLFGNLEL